MCSNEYRCTQCSLPVPWNRNRLSSGSQKYRSGKCGKQSTRLGVRYRSQVRAHTFAFFLATEYCQWAVSRTTDDLTKYRTNWRPRYHHSYCVRSLLKSPTGFVPCSSCSCRYTSHSEFGFLGLPERIVSRCVTRDTYLPTYLPT